MDSYIVIIIATFVGFLALAAALLVPVYRFLQREESVEQHWTDAAVQSRGIDSPGGVGFERLDPSESGSDTERPPAVRESPS